MKNLVLIASLLIAPALFADSSLLWIEAEDAVRTGMSTEGPFSPATDEEANMLSGGKWLNAENYAEKLTNSYAEYEIDIPSDGAFKLIVRRFWEHGPFRWRFDVGEWHEVAEDPGALQSQQMQKYIALNWINAGSAELTAGKHTLRIEMLYRDGLRNQTAFGFDCFVLTPDFFVPNGKYRPNQPIGLIDEGLWGFETSTDPFTNSPIDLRYLNEAVAGENGPVTAKGDKLYLADGTETRFWMVNFHNHSLDLESMRYIARQYAKSGVNMVRLFIPIFQNDKLETPDFNHLDEEIQDGYYKAVAAFREQGIYVKICTYYVLTARVRHEWGMAGFKNYTEKWYQPFGLIFFNEKFQEAYKERNRKLLTTVNPYTGLTMAEDPAVAIIQTQNEDGLFFATFDGRKFVAPEQWESVCEQFGDFLTKKHGSLDAAIAAWDIPKEINDKIFVLEKGKDPAAWIFDAPEKGQMQVSSGQYLAASFDMKTKVMQVAFPPAERRANAALIQEYSEGVERRITDCTEFLMQVQCNFNEEMIGFYKNDLSSKALITSGNWHGGWGQSMNDRERYTYLSDDIIDRHVYQSPFHRNPKNQYTASWQINVGDSYQDYSALEHPWFLPLNYKMFSDKPHIISECNWSSPNFKQLEGPWLISVFGARNGLDGFTWFNVFTPGYDVAARKFPVATPNILGQFPATALLYRKGYVKEAPPMAHENRTVEDLRGHVQPSLGESTGYDPSRDPDLDTTISEDSYGKHPFAFLAAPTTWAVTNKTSLDIDSKLNALVDIDGKEVRGALGQTTINWETGLATVDTPKAQGAVGTIGTQKFSDCTVSIGNDFASVLIVPLDDLPLAESKKILVQIGVHARPYGWREEPNEISMKVRGKEKTFACKKITSLGEGMYNLPLIDGTVVFKNPITGAVALDANGYPKADVTPVIKSNTLTLPANALYTIVTR